MRAFIEATIAKATEHGHVTTLWGRRRQIPELQGAQLARAHARRAPRGQHLIQGTAADVLKLAMVRAHEGARATRSVAA